MIAQRFKKVFGNQFMGHNAHLAKKLNQMRLKMMNDFRNGKKQYASDFMDIHRYRNNVNANVFRAIEQGIFQKVNNLDEVGNLMEHEERFTYYIHPSLYESKKEPNKSNSRNKYGVAFSKQMDNNKSFAFMDDNQAQELDL